jgi:hypothetical protein
MNDTDKRDDRRGIVIPKPIWERARIVADFFSLSLSAYIRLALIERLEHDEQMIEARAIPAAPANRSADNTICQGTGGDVQ